MPYGSPHERMIRQFRLAMTCPHLAHKRHCSGGDYCPFPPGDEMLCCVFCPRFTDCPDSEGVCVRLKR